MAFPIVQWAYFAVTGTYGTYQIRRELILLLLPLGLALTASFMMLSEILMKMMLGIPRLRAIWPDPGVSLA